MRTGIKIILQCPQTHTHTHTPPRWISPPHHASFSTAAVSIRMKMKFFATQIGFALMKVISLGKKSRLIHKMRIDSDCAAAHFFFFGFLSSCITATPPDHIHSFSQDSRIFSGIQTQTNVQLIAQGLAMKCLA